MNPCRSIILRRKFQEYGTCEQMQRIIDWKELYFPLSDTPLMDKAQYNTHEFSAREAV